MTPDEEFIKPFVEAAQNVFSAMLSLTAVWNRTTAKTNTAVFADITAIMGTAEGGAAGLLAVSMPPSVAMKIGAGFTGMELKAVDQDVQESVRELLNMIAGGAKAKLEGTPFYFKLSIPTLVIGNKLEICHKPNHRCTVAELAVDGEPFVIEVSMKR